MGEQFRSPTPHTSSQAATGKDKGLVGVFPAQGPCWTAQRLGKPTPGSNGYKEPGHGSRLRRGKHSPHPSTGSGAVRDTRKMAPAGGKNAKKVSVWGPKGALGSNRAAPHPSLERAEGAQHPTPVQREQKPPSPAPPPSLERAQGPQNCRFRTPRRL